MGFKDFFEIVKNGTAKAKAGHKELIAPLMNLSKVTRTCIHLQPIMMNVKLGMDGMTQLHISYCRKQICCVILPSKVHG